MHFSILRFVFDYDTLERRKSQNAISYPLQLDMGQFLSPDAHGEQQEVWYDLKGVLMHKGQSAHHGHYVAQIYDEGCVLTLRFGCSRYLAWRADRACFIVAANGSSSMMKR